ncbi:MAG: hypothetical protein M5U01_16990 [Ardenticatenaceae bacterium]|nr:hypothetical protein [Ardenticatenaceae bacterium]
MEDLDFAGRLERAGRTVCLAPVLETSARRYRGRLVRAIANWAAVCALFSLGVPASVLGRLCSPCR